MNTTINYIPNGDTDRVIWLNNFALKLDLYATQLGITSVELQSVKKYASMYAYTINTLELYKQYLNNLTGYKNLMKHFIGNQQLGSFPALPNLPPLPDAVPEGIFDRISKLVTRIKHSLSYTDNIGQDLGIIATKKTKDISSLQPKLSITLNAGVPIITCPKGKTTGIALFANRNDGNDWVLVGRFLLTKYTDTTPLPDTYTEWHYKAIYYIDDEQVGLMSKVEKIVVKRMG